MRSSSQSPHFTRQPHDRFTLQWIDRSQSWLDRVTKEPTDWNWLVSHHQLLTLAKNTDRQVGVSILWFTVFIEPDPSNTPTARPVAFGALLPGHRVALVAASTGLEQSQTPANFAAEFARFLKSKIKIVSVMGSRADLSSLGFLRPETDEIIVRQLSWGKRLVLTDNTDPRSAASSHSLTTRRAGESDRTLLQRWAKIFAGETGLQFDSVTREVSEWMKRGRLVIFEIPDPAPRSIAMAALSGDYTDDSFGRTCRLSLIFVEPTQRGRGYGRLAIEALEHEARLENAGGLVLYSEADNKRIHRFYSGLGFKLADDWIEVEAGFTVSTTG